MSVSFRFARPDEVHDVGRLSAHSFPGLARTPDWWADQLATPRFGGGPEIAWVGEDDGQLVASCQLHPLREWVSGAPLPTMGLGTVAIAPTHRKRGLAGRLVSAALRAARERGDVASALYPFRVSFYARLGYGLAGEALQYRIPPEALPDSDERKRVELAESPEAHAEVRALYAAWAPTQTGMLVRGERAWEGLLAPPDRGLVAYRGAGERLEGYALVAYRTDLPPQERFLEVEEMVWTTDSARRGLYAWLLSLGDQWRQIVLRSLPAHRLGDWISEPRLPLGSAPGWGLWFPSAILVRGPMFRLVDSAAAWVERTVAAESALTLALEVQDPQLPENSGSWRLRLEAGRVHVEQGVGGPEDMTLRLDISALSRIYVGALPPSAAVAAGLAETDRPERLAALDAALALPEPWTFDRF
ncbi:MAG TPA: GNAT family N-acetyltransferase [Longimicrobiaceae bacterium]|nr:GNAT family N-acetyltransferase [Longimicrobiaceae bacterium]